MHYQAEVVNVTHHVHQQPQQMPAPPPGMPAHPTAANHQHQSQLPQQMNATSHQNGTSPEQHRQPMMQHDNHQEKTQQVIYREKSRKKHLSSHLARVNTSCCYKLETIHMFKTWEAIKEREKTVLWILDIIWFYLSVTLIGAYSSATAAVQLLARLADPTANTAAAAIGSCYRRPSTGVGARPGSDGRSKPGTAPSTYRLGRGSDQLRLGTPEHCPNTPGTSTSPTPGTAAAATSSHSKHHCSSSPHDGSGKECFNMFRIIMCSSDLFLSVFKKLKVIFKH